MGAAIDTGGKLEPPVPMAVRWVPLVPVAGHVLNRREVREGGCR